MMCLILVFFFKHKTAYEMRISDWSSDVCSSDLQSAVSPLADVRVLHPCSQVNCSSLLDDDGRRALHEQDQLLQERQPHGRFLPVVRHAQENTRSTQGGTV